MKQILADITPMGSNNLFVTHYWPDKQTDPPLHYHEDYMLCLTLHVRGQRIMDDAVEDFTEKDLVLINPGTPHRFKRDAAYADAKCETATVMFSREMPDWKFLSLEHMRPIREMLLRPAAGLRFAPKTIDTVLERMISLPKLDGFEAVSLFFTIRADQRTSTFQGEYIRTPCWFRASRTVLYSFIISPSSERAKASRTLTFSEAMIAAKPVGSSFTSTTR